MEIHREHRREHQRTDELLVGPYHESGRDGLALGLHPEDVGSPGGVHCEGVIQYFAWMGKFRDYALSEYWLLILVRADHA
jgi:hypothetical protein